MFITGFAAVTLKASREAPQAKVLSKPFHLRDLVMEVERVFWPADRRSGPSQNRRHLATLSRSTRLERASLMARPCPAATARAEPNGAGV
jgi:hypothetical protein